MKRHIIIGLCVFVAGCASTFGPKQVNITSGFDPGEVAWFNSSGTGSISGQAFFQTRGGQPRTCAGLEVTLQPRSAYGDERLIAIYGNVDSGFAPALSAAYKFEPDVPAFKDYQKHAVCDAQGNFYFSNLPAGTYRLTAAIVWAVPGQYFPSEGGALLKSVTISDGENKRIIMAP